MDEQAVIDLIDNLSNKMTRRDYIDFLINIKDEIESRLDAIEEEDQREG